ncbi:hypothetical protein SteCoe_1730 [Stentor coeruleus]|uniref:Uncharacterized protein n=1 Tax=Stentor coeruleus TaxID=5963 RepID=A0A1R2D1A4_9CILI|nr:hypothetical protein SteCoe_1730 [Stentor coeruleus]
MSDKQITTKLQLAQKSLNLSLSSLNIFKIPEKVFNITNLLRLDISNNNIETIPSSVGQLIKLKQLWANVNPLRLVPIELSHCKSLESLDLSNTKIIELPRDLALLHRLGEIKLDNCPLNEKLKEKYSEGITAVWKYLQRKVDRKNYKEEVFRRLRESIYVGEDPRKVMELTLSIFQNMRDVDTNGLKLFVHNMGRIFPEKIEYALPERIREKIEEILMDLDRRAELSELTLKLKSKYPQEDLPKVAQLALTLSQTYNQEDIQKIFKNKLLPEDFQEMEIPALSQSLTQIREKHEHQMERSRLALFSKFKTVYGAVENVDDLQACADDFSLMFQSPLELRRFVKTSDKYLPESFKDFNAEAIFNNFKGFTTTFSQGGELRDSQMKTKA